MQLSPRILYCVSDCAECIAQMHVIQNIASLSGQINALFVQLGFVTETGTRILSSAVLVSQKHEMLLKQACWNDARTASMHAGGHILHICRCLCTSGDHYHDIAISFALLFLSCKCRCCYYSRNQNAPESHQAFAFFCPTPLNVSRPVLQHLKMLESLSCNCMYDVGG